ncbi:MAG: glycoside hydrolase family 97 catalytic domain-containing protein [Breznakibacter sp.]
MVEGWNYGWDGNWSGNGDAFNFTRAYPDFDLPKVCRYGAAKNVALIGHHETAGAALNYERQMEDAFKLYHENGVTAVKTGYVNKYLDGKEWHDGQYGVRHYRKVVETAAKYHLMIDNHEPVKPTGLCRTYPNLMTQEGARGQEYDAWSADGGNPPSYTTVIPFTRMLAGPFDFTPGTFNFENTAYPGTRAQTTLAKQLALFVVIYSPLQMASDLPENYEDDPAFKFIKDVPCDWHTTVVPNGEIGHYVTIARKDRNSQDWYVGAITNELPRSFNLDLSFLDNGKKYLAEIYADGKDADWKDNPRSIRITQKEVASIDSIRISMAPGGGCAVRFHLVD